MGLRKDWREVFKRNEQQRRADALFAFLCWSLGVVTGVLITLGVK